MNIRLDDVAGVPVFRLVGDLVQAEENPLFMRVAELLDGDKESVVLDLSNVAFINSGGLRDLINMTAQANAAGHRLLLAAPSPFVAGVIETTKLNRFFDVVASVDEAIGKLRTV